MPVAEWGWRCHGIDHFTAISQDQVIPFASDWNWLDADFIVIANAGSQKY
jgi:hypothetical protein